MENNRAKGSRYERAAASYLEQKGYRVLEKNYRCRIGEIDLIAKEKDTLVFIEVKYRRNAEKGYPQEAVTPQKQQKIRQAASLYLMARHLSQNSKIRFDVVAILGDKIELIQNAFGG